MSGVLLAKVFNRQTEEFEFRPGPVFANVVLADEINRASPKTQAALLESMQENQVTVDGVSYELAAPFMVIATQNPIEYEGTYPLPEAQLDRFTMRIAIGYPPLSDEAKMLTEQTADPPLGALRPIATASDAVALAEDARAIYVEESLNRYVVAVLRHTRTDPRLYLGASPRAGIALLRVAKARALVGSIGRVHIRRRPGDDARARLPFFCRDLLHHLDLKIPLRNQLLELRVLLLELTQPLHIDCFQLAKALAPGVDRDIADTVLLGHLRYRRLVRLAQDLAHLLFAKPALPHRPTPP